MIWHDVQQNTEHWLQLRGGRVGGSSIGKIMSNFPKTFGEPAKQLAVQVAIEQLTGRYKESGYSNAYMERGHELEPIARALYEQEFFCTVTNGGYFEDGIVGVSPDGLVDDDGAIEIKSVIDHVQYATVKRGDFDPKYKWQLYLNLKTAEREWIDYVSFCPEFPEGKQLFVCRVYRKDCTGYFSQIEDRIGQFSALVEEVKGVVMK